MLAPVVKVPVALQPLIVTVTVSVTMPDEPAVNVIDDVLAPAVMVPPVMVQAYVVPAAPVGTDALLPVDPGATVCGAVMVVAGVLLTVTATGADVPEQLVVSVTVTVYEPLVVTTIDCVVAPVDHE